MGAFKRFALIVASIATIIGVGVLMMLWLLPDFLAPALAWFILEPWMIITLGVLLAITTIGVLVVLLWALFAPGTLSSIKLVADRDLINVSKDAIASTVKTTVESYNGITADKVKIKILSRKVPALHVKTTINPGKNVDLINVGNAIGHSISLAITNLTGYPPEEIRVTFNEAQEIVIKAPVVIPSTPVAPQADAASDNRAAAPAY